MADNLTNSTDSWTGSLNPNAESLTVTFDTASKYNDKDIVISVEPVVVESTTEPSTDACLIWIEPSA